MPLDFNPALMPLTGPYTLDCLIPISLAISSQSWNVLLTRYTPYCTWSDIIPYTRDIYRFTFPNTPDQAYIDPYDFLKALSHLLKYRPKSMQQHTWHAFRRLALSDLDALSLSDVDEIFKAAVFPRC